MRKVAAIFVEEDGIYSGDDSIDVWGISRDARNYAGPYPVVAHPPCNLWGNFAAVNYKRWGGEHNRPGNDGGCFLSALNAVKKYGGVLEHPAYTRAWKTYGLARPSIGSWTQDPSGGWITEVCQCAYGHRARKKTWLFYYGKQKPFDLNWECPEAAFQIGYQDQRGKARNKPTLPKKERIATPIAFRDMLLDLARSS